MFKITSGHGFHIEFNNGVALSTQFGNYNYCENRKMQANYSESELQSCSNAEIGVWDKTGKWITKQMLIDTKIVLEPYDDVEGWVTVENWVKMVNWCNNYRG